MNDIRFTDEQVMTTLRAVVAERPDYVYEEIAGDDSCLYVHNGAPSCLVGHVLFRLGLPLDVLSENEGGSPGMSVREFGISHRAADVLDIAQARQDVGESWGDALAAAEGVWER